MFDLINIFLRIRSYGKPLLNITDDMNNYV